MSIWRLTTKVIWVIGVKLRSRILFAFYWSLRGVFFQHIGLGTAIYGLIHFGSVSNNNISVGRKCVIGRYVYFAAARNARIELGDCCHLATGVHLVAVHSIEIGANTLIGEYVSIRDQNHGFEDPNRLVQEQDYVGMPIKIGSDVWIGRGCFIGPGVTIGDGCIVGANSVVTKSLPPRSVAVGAPARVVRKRGDRLALSPQDPLDGKR